MSELRITDTNSANDSRGRAFGLEGNDFIFLLVALMVAFGLFLVLNLVLHTPAVAAGSLTVPIFILTAVWVIGFRLNRPAGYAEDWWDDLINREGWSHAPNWQPSGNPSIDEYRRS